MRAAESCSDLSFEQLANKFCKSNKIVKAAPENRKIYEKLLQIFIGLETEYKY